MSALGSQEQERPHPITKLGLIVDFDAGVVTGFTGITARIDQVNANSISFKGTTVNPPGTEWSVHGIIDRITGSLDATVLRSITGGSYSGGGSSIRALGKCIDPKQARG